jgi:hypothetical protein
LARELGDAGHEPSNSDNERVRKRLIPLALARLQQATRMGGQCVHREPARLVAERGS